MNEQRFHDLLSGYLQDSLNAAEEAELMELLEKFWLDSREPDIRADDGHEGRIKSVIGLLKNEKKRPSIKIMMPWMAAAVMLLVALAWLFYQQPASPVSAGRKLTVTTRDGQQKMITLTDGTKVFMNAGSSLTLDADYNADDRIVSLQGEAFFEVLSHPEKPFLVRSRDLQIQVLGTSFNIRNYDSLREDLIQISTGKVRVTSPLAKLDQHLIPGQQLRYNPAGHTYRLGSFATDDPFTWRSGDLLLDEASFDELAFYLSKRYGVYVRPPQKNISKYRYTIHLKKGIALRKAVDILQSIDGLTYVIKQDTVWVK